MGYKINDAKTSWRIVDNEAVIIQTETSDYFCLNESGTCLWQRLSEAALTPAEAANLLAAAYGRPAGNLQGETEEFFRQLIDAQLVKSSEARAAEGRGAALTPLHPYEPPQLVRFGDLETLILSGE